MAEEATTTIEFAMLVRPSPLAMAITPSGAPAEPKLVLRIESVVGSFLFPITTDQADQLGRAMQKAARETKLQLTDALSPEDLAELRRIAEEARASGAEVSPIKKAAPAKRARKGTSRG